MHCLLYTIALFILVYEYSPVSFTLNKEFKIPYTDLQSEESHKLISDLKKEVIICWFVCVQRLGVSASPRDNV